MNLWSPVKIFALSRAPMPYRTFSVPAINSSVAANTAASPSHCFLLVCL